MASMPTRLSLPPAPFAPVKPVVEATRFSACVVDANMYQAVSEPVPPSSVLLPALPKRRSLPSPPNSLSLPTPPSSLSFPVTSRGLSKMPP